MAGFFCALPRAEARPGATERSPECIGAAPRRRPPRAPYACTPAAHSLAGAVALAGDRWKRSFRRRAPRRSPNRDALPPLPRPALLSTSAPPALAIILRGASPPSRTLSHCAAPKRRKLNPRSS